MGTCKVETVHAVDRLLLYIAAKFHAVIEHFNVALNHCVVQGREAIFVAHVHLPDNIHIMALTIFNAIQQVPAALICFCCCLDQQLENLFIGIFASEMKRRETIDILHKMVIHFRLQTFCHNFWVLFNHSRMQGVSFFSVAFFFASDEE